MLNEEIVIFVINVITRSFLEKVKCYEQEFTETNKCHKVRVSFAFRQC